MKGLFILSWFVAMAASGFMKASSFYKNMRRYDGWNKERDLNNRRRRFQCSKQGRSMIPYRRGRR